MYTAPTYPLAACCQLKGYILGCGFCFFGEVTLNTIVYIDGFNLYYAIRGKGYKWLNVKALAELVLAKSRYNVTGVKYYTARVSGATDPA